MERIARDSRYFTHLKDCGSRCEVIIGDARLSLQNRSDQYDVLVLDAFSSDSIPIHLLTAEAIRLFFDRLEEDGILALHISNRYLKLEPVVARLGEEALGQKLFVRVFNDYAPDPVDDEHNLVPFSAVGKSSSTWVVLARSQSALGREIRENEEWKSMAVDPNVPLWTDAFSNIRSVLNWDWKWWSRRRGGND